MPVFIDTHEGTELPPDVKRTVESRVRSGNKDQFGVVDRGILIDRDANAMHCVLEANDVNAVVKHHQSLNVPVDRHTIHRADAILK